MSRVIDAIIQLTDKFTSPMSHTIKAMTEATAEGNRMRKSIANAGKTIQSVGQGVSAAVTMPIIGAGVACGKMASDFENGIAKVSTIADTSVMSIDQIKRATLDLSNQLGVSVTDISEAQYNAISAGAATEKSLDLVSTAVKAAKAGFTDTATAVDGLTTVYNSFGGAVDYEKLSDQMLQTQNYGKTTFGELASSIGQVTPVANSLNVSTDELFSSIAILTKNGIATSSAITGLKAAYSNILKPTSDASKTAKKLGLDFSATHLKAVGWAKFMEEVKEKTNGDADAMAKLFGSVEALNSMTVLAGAGLDDFNNCLGQMNSAAGLTQQSYEKMLTPSERWQIALNKIKNAGIQVGEKLLPVFEKVTGVVDKVADRFANMSDEQVNSLIKLAAGAAAVGPVIIAFGKTVTGASKLLGVISKVSKAGGVFKLAFAAMSGPVGIVIAAIFALIAVVIIVRRHMDVFKRSLGNLGPIFQSVNGHIQSIIAKFKAFWAVAGLIAKQLAHVFAVGLTMAIGKLVNGVATGIDTMVTIIDGLMTAFGGLIDFITGVFTLNWDKAWHGLATTFGGIADAIIATFKGAINGLISTINGFLGGLNGLKIPDWVPGVGGKTFSMPQIPMLAKGTRSWQGGIAQVNERGGEIIDLPSGSRVYPHDESIRKARAEGEKSISFQIAKLADQIVVREESDIDKIADRLCRKLQAAAGTMGGVSVADMA